jgi:hypothetical protein
VYLPAKVFKKIEKKIKQKKKMQSDGTITDNNNDQPQQASPHQPFSSWTSSNIAAGAAPNTLYIPPAVWGPRYWYQLHLTSKIYTPERRQEFLDYLRLFHSWLPCPDCRRHFGQLLKDYPVEPYLDSAERLQRWVYDAHKRVNERVAAESGRRGPGGVLFDFSQLDRYLASPALNHALNQTPSSVSNPAPPLSASKTTTTNPAFRAQEAAGQGQEISVSGWMWASIVLIVLLVVVSCVALYYALSPSRRAASARGGSSFK